MKLSWACLVLVALATSSTLEMPPGLNNDFHEDRYIDDDDDETINEGNNNGDLANPSRYPCPDSCACYVDSYTGTAQLLLTTNCSMKGLIRFPASLPNQTQVLDMSHNKLINITALPVLSDLLVLDLSSNWMRLLDNQWVFEHVVKLRVLSLADNGLQSLQHGSFSGLVNLRELDLARNIIKRIETHAFSGMGNLEVLRLDNNQLYQLKREWFLPLTSLTALYLNNNFVAKLENNTFSKLARLHHLDLSYNFLRDIPDDALNGLSNLKLLNLSGNNNLRNVPNQALQPCTGLNILLMDGVAMSRLQPFGVSSIGVAEMSLSFLPRLRVVEKSAFYNLTKLRTLQLHDNPHLVFIHPSAFSALPLLRHLLIHNNGLTAVSSQIITSLPSLTDLHLHHNPLHCDCNIFWLRKELDRLYQSESKNKILAGLDSVISASDTTINSSTTFSPPSSTTITNNSNNNIISIARTFISEPDRISCYFPADRSSMPMIQLPFQYFSPTCPPLTLPLFSAFINVSLGDELWLECQGLGVPTPTLSWILPGGLELNYSTASHTMQNDSSGKLSMEIVDDSLLYIPSVKQSDSGSYGCRAVSPLGGDNSTTVVHVQTKPLTLSEVKVSNDYITVSWKGSIPRVEMSDFQIFYRHIPSVAVDATDNTSKQTTHGSIFLHSSFHTYTIEDLKPQNTYEVCLMYKKMYPLECHNYTTSLEAHIVEADGIRRVSKTHLGIGVASVLGLLLTTMIVLVVRKVRHRKEYIDPLTEEEKASIPLEGIIMTAPSTPLTTSRTALLINSQI